MQARMTCFRRDDERARRDVVTSTGPNSERGDGMTRTLRPMPVIIFLAMLTGCVGGPPLQTTVITKPSRRLEIYGVHAYQHKGGVLVTGTVRRPVLAKGAIWGHLHLEGLFDDRRPPVIVDTRWGSLSPRGSRTARFSALLPTTAPLGIKSVRVEYRSESDRARAVHPD